MFDACFCLFTISKMDNNRLNAQLLRDTAAAAGLLADQAGYAPLEEDIAPLRAEHAANLAQARTLEDVVLADITGAATAQKKGARRQLRELGTRLAAALQGYAASAANPDQDLAGRVRFNRTSLTEADDATFASIITALLKEAQPLAAPLTRREFTPADRTLTEQQLLRFEKKQTAQRTTAVTGATARKTLIALLARNTALLKQIRVQLKPYQYAPAKQAVWLRFQGYTKLIVLGQRGPKDDPPTPPAA